MPSCEHNTKCIKHKVMQTEASDAHASHADSVMKEGGRCNSDKRFNTACLHWNHYSCGNMPWQRCHNHIHSHYSLEDAPLNLHLCRQIVFRKISNNKHRWLWKRPPSPLVHKTITNNSHCNTLDHALKQGANYTMTIGGVNFFSRA